MRFHPRFLDPPPRPFVVAYLVRMLDKRLAREERERRAEALYPPPDRQPENPPQLLPENQDR